MHKRADVLHLDLKPDNICISRPAIPDPALPACATLIDFTTCMPIRDFKGEREPVSTLGVTSFSSLRMEAHPGEHGPDAIDEHRPADGLEFWKPLLFVDAQRRVAHLSSCAIDASSSPTQCRVQSGSAAPSTRGGLPWITSRCPAAPCHPCLC